MANRHRDEWCVSRPERVVFDFSGFQNVFGASFFSLTTSGEGNDLYLNYINPEGSTVPEPGSIAAMVSLELCAAGAVVNRRKEEGIATVATTRGYAYFEVSSSGNA